MNTKHPFRLRHWIKVTAILAAIGAVSALSSAHVRGAVRDAQVGTLLPTLANLAFHPITEFIQGPVAGQGDGRTVPGAQAKPGAPAQPPAEEQMVSLLVKTAADLPDDAVDALANRAGGKRGRAIGRLRLHVIRVPQVALEGVMHRFKEEADVERVEVEQRRQIAQDAVQAPAPTDPAHDDQWALEKIRWNAAWSSVTPVGSARIAVLDTGVSTAGGDINVGEGWSAFGTDPKVDANGHGTWVASIAAAAGNNNKGLAGVSFANTTVLPVQVLDANGLGQDSDIISGVLWAVENKADVILMAFSNPGYSQSLQDAIDLAWANGIVVVAAAGNEASSTPTFPAGDSRVVGVAATDQADVLWAQSNYGKAAFLAAPGAAISGLRPDGSVLSTSGTSASSAMVAGAAALLKVADPSASNGVIVGRLARNADVAGTQEQTGNGRLNIERALADTSREVVVPVGAPPEGDGGPFVGPYTAAACTITTVSVGSQSATLTPGTPASVTYGVTVSKSNGNCGGTFSLQWTAAAPSGVTTSFSPSSFSGSGTSRTTTLTVNTTAATPGGTHGFTVTAGGADTGGSQSGVGALVLGKANQTITFNAVADRTFGDAAFAVDATASSNLAVSFASTTTSVCTVSGATVTVVTAGSCTIRASQGGNASYNAAPDVDRSFTVAKKTLTGGFTADNKAYDGTAAATVLTRTVTGALAADAANVSFAGGTATFDTAITGTGKTVTLTGATLAGSASGNYSLGTTTSWTTTANITAKQVTGTFTAENKQYDGTTAATVLSRSVTGVLPADTENVTFTGGTATFDTAGVGTGKTVTLAGATLGGSGAGNYSLVVASTVTATANITARAITFKADDVARTYGDSSPAFSYGVATGSIVNGDTFGSPNFSAAGTTVGTHAITLSGLANANYDVTFQPGTLTVTKRAITFKADDVTRIYGDGSPAFSYGVQAGSIVDGDSFGAANFSAAGTTVGTHAITLSGLANANYDVTFQPGTLTVTKRAITFKADDVTRIYGDASPAFSYGVQAGSIVDGDSFGAANFSAAGTTVGTHAITLSGLANANYDVTFQPGTLTVTKRAITFKADDVTRIYGDASPAFSYVVQAGSIVDGDSFGAANFSAAGTTVGTHAITLSGLANANYDVTFQPGTLTVTKRAITFKADDVTRIYGDATPAFSYGVQAGSIVDGDSFGAANFSAAGTTVGTHAITLSGLANANYDVTFQPGTLTVTKRAITFKADDVTRIYGESTPAFSYVVQSGSIVNGDTFGSPLMAAAGVTAGIHAITLSGLANGNYAVTLLPGTLTIVPATLAVTAQSTSKNFGAVDPAFSYVVSGLKYSDTVASVLTGALVRDAGEAVGSYAIRQGTVVANANYTIAFTNGILTILDWQAPAALNVGITPNPVQISTPFKVSATIDDTLTGNTNIKSAEYTVDNGASWKPMTGLFTSPAVAVEATHTGLSSGVYQVCVRGTDIHNNIGQTNCTLLAVFDPSGGFVTGGGFIDSPAGASVQFPLAIGRANFGFVSKYEKGAKIPTGETEFQFKAGNLNFHSSVYEWLVVAGARAQYKGTGTINGTGLFGFLLTAIDGQQLGGGGVDKFRIKIWSISTGEIVYDNEMGASDEGNPSTALSGGSIVIHQPPAGKK